MEREPDQGGWDYWTSVIQSCGNNAKCLQEQRAKVSAAFFVEKEFQETGFFIFRLYKAALGRAPSYEEIKSDRPKLAGSRDLKAAKRTFVESWVKRPQFTRLYASNLTTEQFVEALLKNIQATSDVRLDDLRPRLIAEPGNDMGRTRIVQALAEDETFARHEYERAIIFMQYVAYLKREPDTKGLSFWTDVLAKQQSNNYYLMVKAFIDSKEYRSRFLR